MRSSTAMKRCAPSFAEVQGQAGASDRRSRVWQRLWWIDLRRLPEERRQEDAADIDAKKATTPFDLTTGSAGARRAVADGADGACAVAEHAPHRVRRLVDGRSSSRSCRAVCGVCARGETSPLAAACRCSMPTLRLAARVAARRSAGEAAGLLERAIGRRTARLAVADRPPAPGGADAIGATWKRFALV